MAAEEDRAISLGPGLAAVPERLMLAHARGEVLFICGAGISKPALPDFRELVLGVYAALDPAVYAVLNSVPRGACNQWQADWSGLTDAQIAETKRFIANDYDVVLGMLERRLDVQTRSDSRVRKEVSNRLRVGASQPTSIHRALVRLSDRGGATTVVTTNFDLLLEGAAKRLRLPAETYSLGSIPRPTRKAEFAGVLHIHGALTRNAARFSELILTDQDFGEFYLRRRVVPDFIYDAARLFHLVLVGYSANDPPMRYLLNAVAADGSRFDDLKERFTFFGTDTPDPVALEDWKGRGITPIHYDASSSHRTLRLTLEQWARLSAVNGKIERVDAEIRRIVKQARDQVSDADRDLFDHLIRRSNNTERVRLSALASNAQADLSWLDAVLKVGAEKDRGAMIPPWVNLDEHERGIFRATVAFLDKRLAESKTIEWALRLKPADDIQRLAIDHLLNGPTGHTLNEPWATAWRLIEESWSSVAIEEGPSTAIYGVERRLQVADYSGATILTIVKIVAPRLKVDPIDEWRWRILRKPHRPRKFDDLLSARLTSGNLIDLPLLKLGSIVDVPFLTALASALEEAVSYGLDIGRRLGWANNGQFWQLGELARVYYVAVDANARGRGDPDVDHHGIAPSVKLLYEVVSRIVNLAPQTAWKFVQRWGLADSPVHVRLWAAAARDPQLISTEVVAEFLLRLDDRTFWDLYAYPEIAELRAKRFGDLERQAQYALVARLEKCPPRKHWPKKADADEVKNARLYQAVRELVRIEVAGGQLPRRTKLWLDARVSRFPGIEDMSVDEGFPEGPNFEWVSPSPDPTYDDLEGIARLRRLETALATERDVASDDLAKRARDWIQQPENSALLLADLVSARNAGDEFPRVWDRFGWTHSPRRAENEQASQRAFQGEVDHVLSGLQQLSDTTLALAINGISHWLDTWKIQVMASPTGSSLWLRVWPIAVEATNAAPIREDDTDLRVTARDTGDRGQPKEISTLNTPAGKLVRVFLACPSLGDEPDPFGPGSAARKLRDTVIAAEGKSGLIARLLMIEELPYFLRADRTWAEQHLVTPLLRDDSDSLSFWRAIARRTHFTAVLKIIGGPMAERATDRRLGREAQRGLAFSIVVESLHAFREHRDPAVPNSRVTQMLRMLDDEVRAHAANTVQMFVRDLSTKPFESENALSGADVFHSAAEPFLREVWPQERSLTTPGVSRAFSRLPATSGDAFAQSVDTIERFLVPFDCWSMSDYGLYGGEGEAKKLSAINDELKARALVRLLDLTIGTSEGAIVPFDLASALDQIQFAAPQLANDPRYRRLATLARR